MVAAPDTGLNPIPPCPLCQSPGASSFYRDRRRPYLRCGVCALIFVPTAHHLPPPAEKAHYDLHENSPHDQGYRVFLKRLCDPLLERLTPASQGLDFGAGPGPTLSVMLEEAGHPTAIYDPFYAPDPCVLQWSYDFVTCTEAVEHFSQPGRELERLWQMLHPGGWLGIMTKLARDQEAFARWHYKNDPTHVVFFSRETFEWLGVRWNAPPQFVGEDVIFFRKPLVSIAPQQGP